jgi:hypothetical protein
MRELTFLELSIVMVGKRLENYSSSVKGIQFNPLKRVFPSKTLFNGLNWIPFTDELFIRKSSIGAKWPSG